LAGDALFDSQVYNEFSPGNKGGVSDAARAGITFDMANIGFMAEVNFDQFRYPHRGSTLFDGNTSSPNFSGSGICGVSPALGGANGDPGCVTVLGPAVGSAFVNSFDARDTDVDGRIGVQIGTPKIYAVGSYMDRFSNYGYPRLTGVGGGLEKLSNFDQPVDIYGSILYYPQILGKYTDIFGVDQSLSYRLLTYQGGITVKVPKTPLFLDLGYLGNHGINKDNAPINFSAGTVYGGLGLHF
jgi:hypothetical protein